MKVTIHQPVYLPYLGFFEKVAASDIFIIYDTAQFEKGSVHNRQRVRTFQGETWLTIPIKNSLAPFNETFISYENTVRPWYSNHWQTVESNYKRTPFFPRFEKLMRPLFTEDLPRTLDLYNIRLIEFFLKSFGIHRNVVRFSALDIDPSLSTSEKLAEATKRAGGTHYISGPSGKKYLDIQPFLERGITVSFFHSEQSEYPQYHARFDHTFMPNMAALDALLNVGSLPNLPQPLLLLR